VKDEHVLDELSAYVDGEARDPARIARHLQHCESCARRRMELLKLSVHLKALHAPAPNALFVSQVMTRIEAAAPPARPFWLSMFAPAFAGAAALFLLAALGIYAVGLRQAPEVAPVARVQSVPAVSEEQVVEQVTRLLEAGGDVSLLEGTLSPDFAAPEPAQDEDLGEMLALMVLSSSDENLLNADAGDEDLDTMIGNLQPGEVASLQSLLTEYVNEG
jgi:anti-sigma factor RsiW